MEIFRTYIGRVSLISDTWTSTYGEPFVCVSAHWIDDDGLLQKRIIYFKAMEEAHNGFNTKTRIVSCCKNFHLVDKFFSISLDNVTTNIRAMEFLKEDPSIKLLLNGSLMHCDEYGLRKKVIALDTPTRWNSTYKLLHDAIVYRDILTDMYNESRSSDGQFITNDHWSLAKIVHDVLETFDNTTHIFSYVYEPNIHMVILECIKIICTIKQTSLANPSPSVKRLLDNKKVSNLKCILERLCEDYGAVIQPQLVGSSMGASRFGILGLVLKKSRPNGSGSSSSSSNIEDFHITQWWKNHSSKFSVLRIAKNILAIPASTIAFESAFSVGRRVLDEKRSRLSSESIEMC
ncbi:putative AC transposase, partial [Bienertia sinuspersici]